MSQANLKSTIFKKISVKQFYRLFLESTLIEAINLLVKKAFSICILIDLCLYGDLHYSKHKPDHTVAAFGPFVLFGQ